MFGGVVSSVRERARVGVAAALLSVSALGLLAPAQAWSQTRVLPDFTDLVEQVGPAVVNIRTTEKAHLGSGGAGAGPQMDPGLEEFFKRFGIPMPRNAPRGGGNGDDDDEPTRRGIGSGFILSADGLVMTNAHVVDGADELLVRLADKREFKGKVIGADKRSDVAVVKIEATGLPFVKVGDVGKLKVGEWVMAIGSPFDLDNTVTAGIVSAKQRDTGELLPFIQTDVAINPGNSGGPLINMRGEVVGINSQIYSPSGGYAGISFSIPIDEAMRVADQLRATGRVIRGRIGVAIAPVTKEVAESIGLGKANGAMVQSVEAGQPAEKAGLEAGDIIVKVDGKAVERATDLPRMISAVKPGSKVTLQLFRRGAYKDVAVTVGEFDAEKPTVPATPVKASLGLNVVDLSEAEKRDLRVKGGVKIEGVEGAAAKAGLREGDVILSVENVQITDAKQFGGVVAKLDKAKRVTVLVRRGEWVNYVVIQPVR
ncbi:MAG TPA: Do family serine endopeptidase [Ideonella sp.]|uniref:Do family serine endopeptidase n=1 Tax=Ideonella sp. TaxID=1929293 RepID=UPI002C385DDD|nr:Do family serine endopeptidase [Ideonella sp.]HSI48456.1 Do family serine endopeptidase [Ideonella sp.]